jgi:hypothetical protein
MSDDKSTQPGDKDEKRPDADELPDGSASDGSESTDGADTVSGGGADD